MRGPCATRPACPVGRPRHRPRYRQAHLRTFFLRGEDSHAALELAYSDVRRAFLRFLQSIDRTTGIVIAGHSQGSYHGSRILQEFFDGTPLQARLIAAYLPGYPFRPTASSTFPLPTGRPTWAPSTAG